MQTLVTSTLAATLISALFSIYDAVTSADLTVGLGVTLATFLVACFTVIIK